MQTALEVKPGSSYSVDRPLRQVKPQGPGGEALRGQVQRLLSDDFLGELPLPLEAQHYRSHVDISKAHLCATVIPLAHQPADPEIGDIHRLGIVVSSARFDPGDASSQVEILDQVSRSLVEVYGAGVYLEERHGGVHRLQQAAGSSVDDRIVMGRRRAYVDVLCGIGDGGNRIPRGSPSSQYSRVLKLGCHCAGVRPEEPLVAFAQRLLPCGAEQMWLEDVRVGLVDDGVVEVLAEEEAGIRHQVLVEWILLCDEKAQGTVGAPPAASCLLPGTGYATRVAGEHGRIQVADVYAKLQCCGGDQAEEFAVEELTLDPSPVLGQVSSPVGVDPLCQCGRQLSPGIDIYQLGQFARAGEYEAPYALLHEACQKRRRLAVGTAPVGLSFIEEWRVPEREVLLAVGRAIFDNCLKRQADDVAGVLFGICDRRRTADEYRIRAVEGAEPSQPPHDVGHVRTEDAAIDMGLVYDD